MKLKKGDQVKIISGTDKGKQGKVLAAFPAEGKIVVAGMQIKKKHVTSRTQDKKGELVRIPGAFLASRALLVCAKCSSAVRPGYRIDAQGNKSRVCRTCGSET